MSAVDVSVARESTQKLDAVKFLERSLHQVSGGITCITLPAPLSSIDSLIRPAHDLLNESFFWDGEDGTFGALGSAIRISVGDGTTCADLREQTQSLWNRMEVRTHALASPIHPRMLGGLAFAASRALSDEWRALGRGLFWIPRWMYTVTGRHANLSLTLKTDDSAFSHRACIREFEFLYDRLASPVSVNSDPAASNRVTHIDGMSELEWEEKVKDTQARLVDGGMEKVVFARGQTLRFERDVDAGRVFTNFRRTAIGCTRFFLRQGATTFLGATPEVLIKKKGAYLYTEAMAGSMPIGSEHDLLESSKDRREHQFVVDAIVNLLKPFCEKLSLPTTPSLRTLRHLSHLHTPIEGTLKHGAHILDLVSVLHPTPAVGGVPTREALAWIREHEPLDRGWYAGPVGWWDSAGDGEFVVALRSGLVQGQNARVFAGAGIVKGSDPALEYAETSLKMRSLLEALSVDSQ